MSGTNINFFLLDDSPSGRVKCSLDNWTGIAYKIPRTELEKCKNRPDLTQGGVYFLFGISEDTGENVVYVGQADVRKNGNGILGRLQEHKRNADKDYWTEAIAFTSSKGFLSATQLSWLENHFCVLAKNAKRYIVKNGNEPSPGRPTEEVISGLEKFAEYAIMIMGVLGHKVFEPKVPTTTTPASVTIPQDDLLFYCRRNGLEAIGKRTSDGFAVLQGSHVALTVADYVPKGYKELRENNAALIDASGLLSEDVICPSPSAAAVFVIGKNANGLTEWKTDGGKTLKDVEASES
jgi:hypothetical protein